MFTVIVDDLEEDHYKYFCPFCGALNTDFGDFNCHECNEFIDINIEWLEDDVVARFEYFEQ